MTDTDHIPAPAEHAPRKSSHVVHDHRLGGTCLVVGEGETRDEMQASGAWVKSDTSWPVEQ